MLYVAVTWLLCLAWALFLHKCTTFVHAGTPTGQHTPSLSFDALGLFKIVQLTDLHLGQGASLDNQTLQVVNRVLELERPVQLVVLSGDLVSGYAWNGTPGWYQTWWQQLAALLAHHQVHYAITLGNHDGEADLTRAQVMELDMTNHPWSLSRQGPEGITGASNYWLDVAAAPPAQPAASTLPQAAHMGMRHASSGRAGASSGEARPRAADRPRGDTGGKQMGRDGMMMGNKAKRRADSTVAFRRAAMAAAGAAAVLRKQAQGRRRGEQVRARGADSPRSDRGSSRDSKRQRLRHSGTVVRQRLQEHHWYHQRGYYDSAVESARRHLAAVDRPAVSARDDVRGSPNQTRAAQPVAHLHRHRDHHGAAAQAAIAQAAAASMSGGRHLPFPSRLAARIWLLDTMQRGCGRDQRSWGCVGADTLAWMRTTAASLPPAPYQLAFAHIPVPELMALWNTGGNGTLRGARAERVSCPATQMDTGTFSALRSIGVTSLHCGHDHENNYHGTFRGMRLSYGAKSGFGSYGPAAGWLPGAKVMLLRLGQRPEEAEVWIRFGNGTRLVQDAPSGRGPSQYQGVCNPGGHHFREQAMRFDPLF